MMKIRYRIEAHKTQAEYGFVGAEGLVRLGIVVGILAVAAFIMSLGLPSEQQQQIENPGESMVHYTQTLETSQG